MIIDSGIVTGSLVAVGPLAVTGSVTSTVGFTGSLSGSATTAVSSSYATNALTASYAANVPLTASYALSALTASYVANASSFPFTGSAVITGSAVVTGSLTVTGNIVAQTLVVQTITSSVSEITGSSQFGSTTANTHEFTGSVTMTGSLGVIGNITATSFTGSTNFNTLVNKPNLFSSSAQITGNIYAAGALFQFQDLTLGVGTTEGKISTDGGKPIRFFPTNTVESTRFLANGNIIAQNGGTYSDNGYRLQINGAATSGSLFVSGSSVFSGSVTSTIGFTGSLSGIATNATSASYALTASYISGSGGGVGFPFSGSAVITGSLFVSSSFISGSFRGDGSGITGLTGGGKIFTQTTPTASWVFTHNLNQQYPNVTVYDSSNNVIIPQNITATNTNTLTLTFGSAVSGYAIAGLGGSLSVTGRTIQNYFTASTTWSFQHNLGDKFVSVQAFDDAFEMVIPTTIRLVDATSSLLLFDSASSGYAIATIGGDMPAISSSYAGYNLQIATSAPYSASWVKTVNSASYAATASYLNPIASSYVVLTQVSSSLNFADDTAAAAGGVPLGGLYRNGNFILIRIV